MQGPKRGSSCLSNRPWRGKRGLVLDDEFLIALNIQQILQLAGARHVACVANADDAIETLHREPRFDFAVLDVKLDGMNGDSLAIAAILATRRTPFVFLTGIQGEDLHTKQFPQVPIVEKPYTAVALLDAVRRALEAG